MTLALSPAGVIAQNTSNYAGRVIIVSGNVVANDASGNARELTRRSLIYVGDSVITGASSFSQIRMIDGAQISLKESTELRILEYSYDDQSAEDAATLELLQGGFRTITGRIGRENREAYRAITRDLATIGIRGTNYEAILTEAGLVTGVWDGGITIENDFGSLDLGVSADFDYGLVESPASAPRGLMIQPVQLGNIQVVVTEDTAAEEEEDDSGDAGDSDNNSGNDGDDGDSSPALAAPPNSTETTSSVLGTTSDTANSAAGAVAVNPAETNGVGLLPCSQDSTSASCAPTPESVDNPIGREPEPEPETEPDTET